MPEHFDTIVIGGGVGGLVAGAVLAHRGQHVLLLERDATLGGRGKLARVSDFTLPNGPHAFSDIPLRRGDCTRCP